MKPGVMAMVALALQLAGAPAAADAGFAAFHARWRAAVVSGQVEALLPMTHLPFLFEGVQQPAAGFRRQVWPALFTPALRRCWASAPALTEPGQPGMRSLHCAPYALHFDVADGRWGLREFSVDSGH